MKLILPLLLVTVLASQIGANGLLDLKGISALCKALGLGKGENLTANDMKKKFTQFLDNAVKDSRESLEKMLANLENCTEAGNIPTLSNEIINSIDRLKDDIDFDEIEVVEKNIKDRIAEIKGKLKEVNDALRSITDPDCRSSANEIYKFLSKLVSETNKQTDGYIVVLKSTKTHSLLNLKLLTCPDK